MAIKVVNDILTYIRDNLSADYPNMNWYEYDPRGRKYERPFIGVQYRAKAPSLATRTIGSKKYDHIIDIVVGVSETDPALAEEKMEEICSKIMDLFVPWKYVVNNSYLVLSSDYLHEPESSSRLRDEGQIRIKVANVS